MAKKKKQGMKQDQNASKKNAENCVTLEAIEAMSDSDDDEAADVPLSGWSKEAKSLRQAIADGKFNHLIEKFKERNNEDDEIEEISLDSSGDASEEKESIGNEEDEKEEDVVHDDENEAEEEDDGSEEDDDNEEAEADNDITMEDDEDDGDDEVKPSKRQKTDSSEDESDGDDDQNEVFPETDGDKEGVDEANEEEEEDENDEAHLKARQFLSEPDEEDHEGDEVEMEGKSEKTSRLIEKNRTNAKALSVVLEQIKAAKKNFPWAETFDVVPPTPLPFGEHGNPDENPLDIHDDLKREVTFYNLALQAVNDGRKRCEEAGIAFSRPEDFFAEMVKTDGKHFFTEMVEILIRSCLTSFVLFQTIWQK